MSAADARPGDACGSGSCSAGCSGRDPAAQSPAGKAIKAPLVGTFYAAPSPDQPPFVQVGDTVKKGDVVLIIESMKLMNEVTSDVEGVVQEILVKNGDAVEYDQPLMILA
ncbi:MAG: acetyl-CoA carboxylase biotin carboxyl carrier protein [Ruminococcus sp.]